jgi:hypothetical protein
MSRELRSSVLSSLFDNIFRSGCPISIGWTKANAGTCRMLVANSNPIAWDRDLVRVTRTVAAVCVTALQRSATAFGEQPRPKTEGLIHYHF